MIPRKRIDIGWGNLCFACLACARRLEPGAAQTALESLLPSDRHALACLSVRSGFDALLSALALPAGSEILVSALTIRDMPRIIEAHGLIAVPLDLDIERLTVTEETLLKTITPRSQAILIAHLFGSRMLMEPIVRIARERGLVLIEDCAQTFAADGYWGHAQSDVALWSFGAIKTATALQGALLCFRERALRDRSAAVQSSWPLQSRGAYFSRIAKYSMLVMLGYRTCFTLFVFLCRLLRINHDRLISGSVRGFAGGDFFAKIRKRPPYPLIALLYRRLTRYPRSAILRRIGLAQQLLKLSPVALFGGKAEQHSYWVLPILSAAGARLMHHLWRHGFDATQSASAMHVVEPPINRPETEPHAARAAFHKILYLPCDATMSDRDIERLAINLRVLSDNLREAPSSQNVFNQDGI